MQRAGNEKNYDYYFLLCSQKKSRPLGLALQLSLSLSLSAGAVVAGQDALPFWTCRSHCTLQKVGVAIVVVVGTATAAAVFIFVVSASVAAGGSHYALLLSCPPLPCWPILRRQRAVYCAAHSLIFSNWKLKIITRNQFHAIEALNFYQFINWFRCLCLRCCCCCCSFCARWEVIAKSGRSKKLPLLCCTADALSEQNLNVYLRQMLPRMKFQFNRLNYLKRDK